MGKHYLDIRVSVMPNCLVFNAPTTFGEMFFSPSFWWRFWVVFFGGDFGSSFCGVLFMGGIL